VRVVGYVREAPGPQEGESAYSQAERIRRWVAEVGHQLVAVCQDVRVPGHALGRDGYRALLGIVSSGEVEGVVVAGLEVLSHDKVVQEVMMWDLRSRAVTVLSSDTEDVVELEDPPADPSRLIIRDVLARVSDLQREYGRRPGIQVIRVEEQPEQPELVIELIPPNEVTR
jgi:hypothetical protein